MLRRTIQNRRNSKNLQKKLAYSSLRKVYVLKRYIFFGKVKITALIDSGSTVSLLRENTSRRIMDPTKLSKNKMLLTAVIGSDLLEQASISFTKEGVKFNNYENHTQLMQISAENLQDELDLRHVENRQIKKELEKLIQDYKPEKNSIY
ncbi:RVP domain-containing protein [Trichonephila clavipes]|nr:RVP domain-containing protein [Trichonephila clavipes]